MKYAIFSDVHANHAALKAVLDHIKVRYGPAIDYYLFGGDAIGQGPYPNEVCTKLRTIKNLMGVKGDNEATLLSRRNHGLGREAVESIKWTDGKLTRSNREFLGGLEDYIGLESDGMEVLLVHGSPDDPLTGEVYQNEPREELERMMDDAGADILITCHTHVLFVRQLDGRLVMNAGSVGQPRDRDPRACYVFLDTETREVNFHRVNYNINRAAQAARRAGLPDTFAERLYYGW